MLRSCSFTTWNPIFQPASGPTGPIPLQDGRGPCLDRALVAAGRLVAIHTVAPDQPAFTWVENFTPSTNGGSALAASPRMPPCIAACCYAGNIDVCTLPE